MMTSTGEHKRTLTEAIRHLYQIGGVRAYYRGLTVSHLILLPHPGPHMARSTCRSVLLVSSRE
jgi:solute carrier family 25 (mitochondrial phosphate transporter), member 23/24/25/41